MVAPTETTIQRINALIGQLNEDRSTFIDHWRDLANYILPRRARFDVDDRNKGSKKNSKIIDNTATIAADTAAAGMHTGITSSARPWFLLTIPDPELSEFRSVKQWLNTVTQRMRTVFNRSNLYNALPTVYGDEIVYGTAAMAVMEDSKDVIRCYTFPIGSYYLSQNHRCVVDVFVREFAMTVRQLVEQFGIDAVSTEVRSAYERGNLERWINVRWCVRPNPQYEDGALESSRKLYQSVYYEANASIHDEPLSVKGYDDFPVLCPRWALTGEDVYGTSPGMRALGDVMQLQQEQKRKSQGIDKMVNPAMTAPISLQNRKASLLPGDITYVDMAQGQQKFEPAHEVRLPLGELKEDIADIRDRINRAFYADLFRMLIQSDRRQITAREVDERHEEKLLMLGPTLERQNDDMLDPLIDRVFNIMLRRGIIPTPPQELEGMDLRVEYISIMAQAQKMIATAGVERFAGFVGAVHAQVPEEGVPDKVDFDQMIDEYGEMVGVPPTIIRDDEQAQEIRQKRQQAIQQQQQAALAESMSKTAQNLGSTDMQQDSALTRLADVAGAVPSGTGAA